MAFPEADIDRLTPAQREEVQEWLLLRHNAQHAPAASPERRRSIRLRDRRRGWPATWNVNDSERVYLARMAAIPD